MNGLFEWMVFSAGMAVAGAALLLFFFNPLLALLLAAAFIGLTWISGSPHRGP